MATNMPTAKSSTGVIVSPPLPSTKRRAQAGRSCRPLLLGERPLEGIGHLVGHNDKASVRICPAVVDAHQLAVLLEPLPAGLVVRIVLVDTDHRHVPLDAIAANGHLHHLSRIIAQAIVATPPAPMPTTMPTITQIPMCMASLMRPSQRCRQT